MAKDTPTSCLSAVVLTEEEEEETLASFSQKPLNVPLT